MVKPIKTQEQKSNVALVHSNSTVNQLLLYDVITLPANSNNPTLSRTWEGNKEGVHIKIKTDKNCTPTSKQLSAHNLVIFLYMSLIQVIAYNFPLHFKHMIIYLQKMFIMPTHWHQFYVKITFDNSHNFLKHYLPSNCCILYMPYGKANFVHVAIASCCTTHRQKPLKTCIVLVKTYIIRVYLVPCVKLQNLEQDTILKPKFCIS